MQWHEFENTQALDRALARFIAEELRQAIDQRGAASLVLSGGRTPAGFLGLLGNAALDWSKVLVTLADERYVAPSDADSNAGMLQRSLFTGAAVDAQFIPLHTGADITPEEAALRACEALKVMPARFDVVVLGMGEDGHTASIFPDSPQLASALADDAPDCLAVVGSKPPPQRLTLSAARLRRCRTNIVHITGTQKKDVLSQAIAHGPVERHPIRALLLQGDTEHHVYWTP